MQSPTILSEVRHSIGVAETDTSSSAAKKVADALDLALEELTEGESQDEVLQRLSAKGELPSDLFVVDVSDHLRSQIYKDDWHAISLTIHQTVRSPDVEQHFMSDPLTKSGELISLFAKTFPNRFPARSYMLLVIARREGLRLVVHQAWKIYQDVVDTSGAKDLVDVLKRFADVFGLEIEAAGKKGKFLLDLEPTDVRSPQHRVNVLPRIVRDSKGRKVEKPLPQWTMTICFLHGQGGGFSSTLTMAIDIDKYRAYLKAHER